MAPLFFGMRDGECYDCDPMVALTEKLLAAVAGWPVVFEARKIRAAGRVKRARYEPPLLQFLLLVVQCYTHQELLQ